MRLVAWLALLAAVSAAGSVWAGGSGLNAIVVVNQKSTNSIQLGNDYCEARGVPPQNVFRMTNWTGGAVTWSRTDFQTRLLNPMLALLAGRGLTNQAVLLSMDIPRHDKSCRRLSAGGLRHRVELHRPVDCFRARWGRRLVPGAFGSVT